MKGTSYFEIYKRAITEFKDPTLKNMLENNSILFSEIMYNFLVNAISMFTDPKEASSRVSGGSVPYTLTEKFDCDGMQNTFILENPPEDDIIEDSIFEFYLDGEKVDGEYNNTTHTITVSVLPNAGSVVESNIYYIGNFSVSLYDEEAYILSQFIVACWSEFIANDKLDIIRLLGDTDFKLTSNASTTTSKVLWNVTTTEFVVRRMTKYAWNCRFRGVYK